jgi:hypothetical protein
LATRRHRESYAGREGHDQAPVSFLHRHLIELTDGAIGGRRKPRRQIVHVINEYNKTSSRRIELNVDS